MKPRPSARKLQSPEQLEQLFRDYILDCKARPFEVVDFVGKDGNEVIRKRERPLTWDGFENYVTQQIGLMDLKDYASNKEGRYADYAPIVAYARRVIREDQVSGGMAGVYHHNLTARINGIADKVDSDVTANVKLLNIDPLMPE
jgi:hypothetical protein